MRVTLTDARREAAARRLVTQTLNDLRLRARAQALVLQQARRVEVDGFCAADGLEAIGALRPELVAARQRVCALEESGAGRELVAACGRALEAEATGYDEMRAEAEAEALEAARRAVGRAAHREVMA